MADAHSNLSREEARAQGRARFYTGKPCPHGHVCERYTSNGGCVECNAAGYRRWAKLNQHKIRARIAADKERCAAVLRAWNEKNREKLKQQRRAKYLRTIERHRILTRRYQLANREELLAKRREWLEANRDVQRGYGRNRRARLRAAAGEHTAEDVAAIKAAQGGKCAYCRKRLRGTEYEVDHIQPLALGGSNDRRNLQLLCLPCNRSKGARDPLEHANRLGLLL